MKDLAVSNGDLALTNGDFTFVSGNTLLTQQAKLVLGTNKGEWAAEPEQGIDFRVILKKLYNEEEILATLTQGLQQIDPTFEVKNFELVPGENRHYTINFTAVNSEGVTITDTVEGG